MTNNEFFEDFERQFTPSAAAADHIVLDCMTQVADDGSFDIEAQSVILLEQAQQLLADIKAANERLA